MLQNKQNHIYILCCVVLVVWFYPTYFYFVAEVPQVVGEATPVGYLGYHKLLKCKSITNFTQHNIYRPTTKLGKVMFSQVSVILLGGPHVTITHDALDLTVQGPSSRQSPSIQPPTSDIWWPRLEICSNLFTRLPHCTGPPTSADIWWLAIEASMMGE